MFVQAIKRLAVIVALVGWGGVSAPAGAAGALENYVRSEDSHYNWKHTRQTLEEGVKIDRLELVSQHWRGQFWSHHLVLVQPLQARNPDIALLLISGDGDGEAHIPHLKSWAEQAGAVSAVLTQVPNQPLYGRREDHLVAYSFNQYLKSGDETWPLLFPMVKSAVRAMDTVQAFEQRHYGRAIQRFVVAGASKRGWTTWLTAAVDSRVRGIAPMVIDMLNMKAQLAWAERVYGRQSQEISEYTDLNLHRKLDDEPMRRLRSWVDPYAYIARYSMPKLLLLGTNDPYWTVDSLRHYWHELPGPKLVFQTPNGGHHLAGGADARQTLAAFFELIADRKPLPEMSWHWAHSGNDEVSLAVRVNQKANAIRLWSALSSDRDFRDERWTAQSLPIQAGSSQGDIKVKRPASGYRADLLEVELDSPSGQPYKLSTEVRVIPDTTP